MLAAGLACIAALIDFETADMKLVDAPELQTGFLGTKSGLEAVPETADQRLYNWLGCSLIPDEVTLL